jgi:NADH:ubiquinone oxidoreductase subunit K
MNQIETVLILGGCLFSIGLMIVIIKRNTIMMLIGIELMLNASNINLVAFNKLYPAQHDGQMFALFVIIVAICETAVGLAIMLRAYYEFRTSVPENFNELKG